MILSRSCQSGSISIYLSAQESENIGVAGDPPAINLPIDPLFNYSGAYHWCLEGADDG